MRTQILKIFRVAIFLKFHFANRKIAKNIAPVFYLKVNQRQRIGFLRLNKGKKNTWIYFCWSFQSFLKKQPPEVFYKKSIPKNFGKFTWKHLFQNLFLINRPQTWNFIKKETLDEGVFPWILQSLQKKHFLQNTSEWLLLTLVNNDWVKNQFWRSKVLHKRFW